MPLLFSNNATSVLQAALIAGSTTVVIAPGDANLFPQPVAANDYFIVTVEDLTQVPVARERMFCTGRVGNVLTVIRGQEGTSATAFATGSTTVSNRLTAGALNTLAQAAGQATALYLGAFAAAPTETLAGGSLFAGLLYYNTTTGAMNEYTGVAWAVLGTGGATSGGLYIGAYPLAPTARPDNSALQAGDLYYNTAAGSTGLYEYANGAWGVATTSTTVAGNTTFAGNVTVDGGLTVTGASTLEDVTAEDVDSDTGTFATLVCTGNTSTDTLDIGGMPVVKAGDLSGTAYTQKWPNGNVEYWGSAATNGSGTADIVFPTPFPSAITGLQVTITGGPDPNFPCTTNKTAAGFTVTTYGSGGGKNGPVSFDWTAKGN